MTNRPFYDHVGPMSHDNDHVCFLLEFLIKNLRFVVPQTIESAKDNNYIFSDVLNGLKLIDQLATLRIRNRTMTRLYLRRYKLGPVSFKHVLNENPFYHASILIDWNNKSCSKF